MTKFPSHLPSHLVPSVFFVVLALVWTFPLADHISTHLPGDPGDNLAFLWNVWWMREALPAGALSFFHTDRIFAPFGIDLTLHTHTALPAWIGATLLGRFSPLAAQNLVNLASLALNGIAAYALMWDRIRSRSGALVGATIFAGSPYIAAHLLGHFNLICAWCIPLFLLFLFRAIERGSLAASAAAGICLVATAYTDYYYLLYCALLGVTCAVTGLYSVRWTATPAPLAPWFKRVVVLFLLADAALIAWIVTTGGGRADIAGIRVVAEQATNPLAFAWLLLAICVLLRYRPRITLIKRHDAAPGGRVRVLLPAAAVTLAGMLPLITRGWSLLAGGDYIAPSPSWRSGPAGIDLATLFLGNPFHPWSGPWTRRMYEHLHIDRIESVGWLGVVPAGLLVWSAWRHRGHTEVRRWLLIGAAFFALALGPWLRIAGFDTGLLLPQNLLAFVPIVSNARIPGRAMVVVYLAVGMIAAYTVSRIAIRWRRVATVGALVILAADYLPAPFPLTEIHVPRLYEQLRDRQGGTVCELPMGIRDGLGMTGLFDDWVLAYQMVHRHPIVGGFAARVPVSIKTRYRETAVLRSLLELSAGRPAEPRDARLTREEAGAALRTLDIAFVVLNRATAPAALVSYVESSLPLTLLAKEGERELYALTSPAPGPS